jgi:hypothetical protein
MGSTARCPREHSDSFPQRPMKSSIGIAVKVMSLMLPCDSIGFTTVDVPLNRKGAFDAGPFLLLRRLKHGDRSTASPAASAPTSPPTTHY